MAKKTFSIKKIKTFAYKVGSEIKSSEEIIDRQKSVVSETPLKTEELNEKKVQIEKSIERGFSYDFTKQDLYTIKNYGFGIGGLLIATPYNFILNGLKRQKKNYNNSKKRIDEEIGRINQVVENLITSLINLSADKDFSTHDFLIMLLEIQEKYNEVYSILNANKKNCTSQIKKINKAIRFCDDNNIPNEKTMCFTQMYEQYQDTISYIQEQVNVTGGC